MPADDEESWVIRLLAPPAAALPPEVRVGIGDDAAVLRDGRVITVDTMVQGVHWDDRSAAADVGAKLALVNASDVAACGAVPTLALLALSLPDPVDRAWVTAFAEGLREGLAACGATLIGGDTTRSAGGVVVSLTMIGQLTAEPLLRQNAQVGEDLWVSGTLGDASLGFATDAPEGLRALRRPNPPLRLGPALAQGGLSRSAMDLSDGLATDLARLCAAAGVGAEVWPEALPASDELRAAAPDPIPHQVGFGDDYQLVFTAPPARHDDLLALGADLGLRLSKIGRVTQGPEVALRGRPWPLSWQHFPGPQ
ncbi:MAG: thiamine-phosphate kinase [Pseudomonadota bacterium]|jgi:thiamine-monophosphate kinase